MCQKKKKKKSKKDSIVESQVIMLHTFNLHRAGCQLHLRKDKKKEKNTALFLDGYLSKMFEGIFFFFSPKKILPKSIVSNQQGKESSMTTHTLSPG